MERYPGGGGGSSERGASSRAPALPAGQPETRVEGPGLTVLKYQESVVDFKYVNDFESEFPAYNE